MKLKSERGQEGEKWMSITTSTQHKQGTTTPTTAPPIIMILVGIIFCEFENIIVIDIIIHQQQHLQLFTLS